MSTFNQYNTPASIREWCSRQNPTIKVEKLFQRAQLDWNKFSEAGIQKTITKEEAAKLNTALCAVGYKSA